MVIKPNKRPGGKKNTEVRITQKIGKKKKDEALTEKTKRSPDERHTETWLKRFNHHRCLSRSQESTFL